MMRGLERRLVNVVAQNSFADTFARRPVSDLNGSIRSLNSNPQNNKPRCRICADAVALPLPQVTRNNVDQRI